MVYAGLAAMKKDIQLKGHLNVQGAFLDRATRRKSVLGLHRFLPGASFSPVILQASNHQSVINEKIQ